ncbi:MAG: T9SS type A sorting domain-containing protein [Bacteroidia bacterium]|nr:T9SS type A sorting domain-containing protein [Bacteroidia bacterium]
MKTTLLTVAFIIIASMSNAQNNAQAVDWAFNTGSANNRVMAIKYDSQGNVLALCSMTDSASFSGATVVSPQTFGYPSTNYYIGKRNILGIGQILIERGSATGNTYADFSTFNLDAADNIFVGGATFSTGYNFGNSVNLSGKGYMIAKYNANGLAQWAKLYNFGNSAINSYSTDPWKLQTIADGSVVAMLSAGNKFALIKIDALGNELWYKEYNLATNGYASTIKTSNNNFFVDAIGNITLSYNTAVNSGVPYLALNTDTVKLYNGNHSAVAFLLQFDANGNKKSYKGYRGSIGDLAVEYTTGNVLLNWTQYGGQNNTAPMDSLPGNNLSFTNVYRGIVVIDSTGKFIKASSYVITTMPDYKSILPLGGLKALVTCKYFTNDALVAGAQNYSVSSGSVFVWEELDANLNPLHFLAAPIISKNNTTPENVMAAQGNKIAVCATWQRADQLSINVNGIVLTANDKNTSFPTRYPAPFNTFADDVMIAQYDRTLQVTINNTMLSSDTKAIYPNPNNGTFTVISENVGKKLTITDVAGKQVYSTTLTSVTQQIGVELNAGIYLVKVGNNKVQKLIVE